MEKAKTVKIKVEKSQLRQFCSFFMKMQRRMVYDMEQKRYVMDNETTTSLEPEFYNTLCQVTEQLSAKVAEHGYAPIALWAMDGGKEKPNNPLWENTHLTLDERGLDAVKSFLKGVAEVGRETATPDQPKEATDTWEPPIDNEV